MVIPLDANWNDVGSWSALWDVTEKDEYGNALTGDILALDTENSFIHSENKLVAVIGVKDLVVIETDDAVMVAPKNRVQDVKEIVATLKKNNVPKQIYIVKYIDLGDIMIRLMKVKGIRPNVLS